MPKSLAVRARRKAVSDELERIESELQTLSIRMRLDRAVASGVMRRDIGDAITLVARVKKRLAAGA